MRKIKIGNDIRIEFSVMKNGEPEALPAVADITVLVENMRRKDVKLEVHNVTVTNGNIVSFLLKGDSQHYL